MAINVGSVKVVDNSAKFFALAEQAKAKALTEIGMEWDSIAAPVTPVDTGRLRNSRAYKVRADNVMVGYTVNYAPWVNNGTSRQAAQHFFEPTIYNYIDRYKKRIENAYKNA